MIHFYYSQADLFCESLSIASLAQNTRTPFYLYSRRSYLENLKEIDDAFSQKNHLICYALKANSNPDLVKDFAKKGAGADVVSKGELGIALKAGINAEKIVFAGVGKRDDEIIAALDAGILGFNVESEPELEVINDLAGKQNKQAPISLRVNPAIDIHGHPYISTGRSIDKFGIGLDRIKILLHEIKNLNNVKLVGLHVHIGSQIVETESLGRVGHFMAELCHLAKSNGHQLKFVDLGGGLGVTYENAISTAAETKPANGFAVSPQKAVQKLIAPFDDFNGTIIFEPGRSLVATCGVLVTRVLYIKEAEGKKFVIVDAGMSDLIRPSLYQAHHQIVPVEFKEGPLEKCDVVGPICESGDFLGRDCMLPPVKRGDLLAVMIAGAYGFTLSSNYNARPRPAEIIVDGDNIFTSRKQQDLEQIWSS